MYAATRIETGDAVSRFCACDFPARYPPPPPPPPITRNFFPCFIVVMLSRAFHQSHFPALLISYTKVNYITSPSVDNSPSLLLFSTQSIYQGGRSSILTRYDSLAFCVNVVILTAIYVDRRGKVRFVTVR